MIEKSISNYLRRCLFESIAPCSISNNCKRKSTRGVKPSLARTYSFHDSPILYLKTSSAALSAKHHFTLSVLQSKLDFIKAGLEYLN